MKLAIIGYVPPPKLPVAKVFLDNVRKFQHSADLLLFSDHKWDADIIPINGDPEMMKNETDKSGKPNPFALNNLLFFTGLRIALAHKVTHIIYLESDCRVGCDHWDEKMFEQYFTCGKPAIIGGTPAVYNPMSSGIVGARRWEALVRNNARRNYPIATYGWKGAADGSGSCVFVNGALGIYDMAWMTKLFDLTQTRELAMQSTAWDMAIGVELWKLFGPDVYDVVAHLDCVFSSYGDIISSEAERLNLVRNGQCVATHQVKSQATL